MNQQIENYLPNNQTPYLHNTTLETEIAYYRVISGFYSKVLSPEPFNWHTFRSFPILHKLQNLNGGTWHITEYDHSPEAHTDIQTSRLYIHDKTQNEAYRYPKNYPLFIWEGTMGYWERASEGSVSTPKLSIQKEDLHQSFITCGLALYAKPRYNLHQCTEDIVHKAFALDQSIKDIESNDDFANRWAQEVSSIFEIFAYCADDSNVLTIYCTKPNIEIVDTIIAEYVYSIPQMLAASPCNWIWSEDDYYMIEAVEKSLSRESSIL